MLQEVPEVVLAGIENIVFMVWAHYHLTTPLSCMLIPWKLLKDPLNFSVCFSSPFFCCCCYCVPCSFMWWSLGCGHKKPHSRGSGKPHRVWKQEASLLGFSWERYGRVNWLELAILNNSCKLWAIGVVFSCLVCDPGMIKAEEYCLLVEEVWLWTGWFAYQRHSPWALCYF